MLVAQLVSIGVVMLIGSLCLFVMVLTAAVVSFFWIQNPS